MERMQLQKEKADREERENGQVTKEEAEKLGFNFSRGPMKFENKKKKKDPNEDTDHKKEDAQSRIENQNKGKNLREIINQEKQKSEERRKREKAEKLEGDYGKETIDDDSRTDNYDASKDSESEVKSNHRIRNDRGLRRGGRGRGRGDRQEDKDSNRGGKFRD